MPRIDGIKYPDTFRDVLKDAVLKDIYMPILRKRAGRTMMHLFTVKPNFKPKDFYDTFFAPGCRYPLDDEVKDVGKPAMFLAETDNWEMRHWTKIYKKSMGLLIAYGDANVKDIYTTKEFAKHHAKVIKSTDKQAKKDVKGAVNDIKIDDRMLQQLGISDKKGLTKMVAALHTDNEREAEKIMEGILKKEKNKDKPKDIVTRFKKLVKWS